MQLIGEGFAVLAAFLYALGSVGVTLDARENGGRGTSVVLSVAITAVLSGVLWLLVGQPIPGMSTDLLVGIGYFCLAGLLATVLGRVFFFRSIELTGAVETSLLRRLIPVFATALAVVFLGEALSAEVLLAFALVFSGVAIVVLKSPGRLAASRDDAAADRKARMAGRGLAVGSAASYGGAYVTRKFGMMTLPDPLAGTFIGAIVGLVFFAAASPFSPRYRSQIATLLNRPTRWQALSAGAISCGQISQFAALKYTSVTNVAIIASIEMFFAAWLAGFVIRSEPRPGMGFAIASLLAMAGVVVLALERGGP
ncbi:EamA-like transporter family protein [Roseivivax jejudonensis]|uniref:EamA-like transporter family protein n=1 Tax=Roseivivax jejudonensis TaxID=1529041 RepID=A0A1X6Y3D7_9RHOB|nr:DMT family transporter [Roseivivax jejudonensis]SLN09731.1 EamA-like transporter family protein [Roseivivax jejudonensis]